MDSVKQVNEISSQELKDMLDKGQVYLIDVREPIENEEEKIASSILMSLSSFDEAKALVSKGDKKLVLYCRGGKRSMQAAQRILKAGCSEVYSLEGGIDDWKTKGYPLIQNKNAPIGLMRQVQVVAGSLVLLGVVLSLFVYEKFIYISAFVGAGLVFAGITNTCGLGMLLAKMPWNQVNSSDNSCQTERK